MKNLMIVLVMLIFNTAQAADDIIVPTNSGDMYLKDANGLLFPAQISYSTDGAGHLKLINSSNPVDDSLTVANGKAYLNGADGKLYPVVVNYTTDGNGNVIPIPAGGGPTPTPAPTPDLTLYLQKASNLSDVSNPATSRTNLGLGTAATHAATDFDASGAAATAQAYAIQRANQTGTQTSNTISDFTPAVNAVVSSRLNYVTNSDAEVDTSGWNLYNDTGRTVPASVVIQDITYTSALSGGSGNGATVSYIFHATQSYLTPLVTCTSSTSVTVAWYNGPTLANNPTATQLKAAWDGTPCAVAIATTAITGTAGNRQYETGLSTLANGGDTAPVDGTGGVVSGVTFTRNTSTPLVGVASFDLGKIASSELGQGVSTDFTISNVDKGNSLQINFAYEGSSGITLGSSSDVKVFLYDITNAVMIPITPVNYIASPVSTIKTFVGQFIASATSTNYRLILHIATSSATAWDLLLDSITVNDIINATTPTQVPSVVLKSQAISGAVTDHMAVVWIDGASQWVPATGLYNGDYWSLIGFATNIVGSVADVFVRGYMDGFSFGPFAGYNQYVDPANAGGLTPAPVGLTDKYIIMGKAISSTAMNIQPYYGFSNVNSAKGSLLTNSGANDGTGDQGLSAGANGAVPFYNSGATLGISTGAAVVASAPFTYTLATRTLTAATATNSVAGFLSAADHTTFSASAPLASPAFTGTPSLPTGTTAFTQTANNNSTKVSTTAYSDAADALKANAASPALTGTVTSAGDIQITTIGKGLQVKTGTNAKIGQATLVGGTKTVANTSVTANSRIFLSVSTTGGTPSTLSYTKSVGTSFTITSANIADTSTIDWYIVESIP